MSKLNKYLFLKLERILENMEAIMLRHFEVKLSYDEAQRLLIKDENLITALQLAGKSMVRRHANYEYELETIIIKLITNPSENMPAILFPADIVYTQEFIDLIHPLYTIIKEWSRLQRVFGIICENITNVRQLNFYTPWLKHIIPNEGFLNSHNGEYHISRWLDDSRISSVMLKSCHAQIIALLRNHQSSSRPWLPKELVQAARKGEELITQFNLMKNIPLTTDTIEGQAYVLIKIVLKSDKDVERWINAIDENHIKINYDME